MKPFVQDDGSDFLMYCHRQVWVIMFYLYR